MFDELPLRHFLTRLDSNEYQTLAFFMFPHSVHVWFIGCVFHTSCPTCAFLMPCSCIAHMHRLHTPCHPYHVMFYFMLLHHFDLIASLACHVYFMLCSILFLRWFVLCLSFISHSSCTPYSSLSLILSSSFALLLLGPFVYSWKKWKEYCHFYMTLVHILRGRNFIGDMHIPRERGHLFLRKPCFVLFYIMFVFLFFFMVLELVLVSMLCYSHRIVFVLDMHNPYTIVLYWLYVHMIICFDMWSL